MFSTCLNDSLYFWRHHLLALFLVSAPFALASQLITWQFGPAMQLVGQQLEFSPNTLVLSLLLWPLAYATLVALLASIQAGKQQSLGMCFLVALKTGPALLVANLIRSLLTGLGLLLFILPGLWIYSRLSMMPFLLVLEGKSPVAALRESAELSGPQQWPLLLGIVITTLAVLMLTGLLMTLLTQLTLLPIWFAPVAGALFLGLISCVTDVYVFRFYLLARE